MSTIDPLTVTVSSLSCCAFFILLALLLVLSYKRDPFCCRTTSSRTTNEPPHYHSRDALVGFGLDDDIIMNCDDFDHQLPSGPFVIGKPSDYYLPGAAPRLPSYESVRRKDRRTLVHHMISERFGLRTSSHGDWEPPPPSYTESLHQPLYVPSLVLGRLDDQGFPAQDQDVRSSNTDHSASSERTEPQLLTSQDRKV